MIKKSFLRVLSNRSSSSRSSYCLTNRNSISSCSTATQHTSKTAYSTNPPITTPSSIPTSLRFFNSKTHYNNDHEQDPLQGNDSDEESTNEWEEEEETLPEIDDGGDGGGVVFGDASWGQRAFSIANEVLLQFSDDFKIFAFKNSPRGYIYVRLDKLSDKYGCPSIEEIEKYNHLYKKRLEEVGESGEIPDDLALEVSSPGAERLLRIPDDLDRFRDMPMKVCYVEDDQKPTSLQKDGVFLLESIETESEQCVWKLSDAKENRDLLGKGRPMSRKQRDWLLTLPFGSVKRVTLYLEY